MDINIPRLPIQGPDPEAVVQAEELRNEALAYLESENIFDDLDLLAKSFKARPNESKDGDDANYLETLSCSLNAVENNIDGCKVYLYLCSMDDVEWWDKESDIDIIAKAAEELELQDSFLL